MKSRKVIINKFFTVLLTIIIFACGNNDAEMERIKKENEGLKNAQLKIEQEAKDAEIQKQKDAREVELQKLKVENETLKKQMTDQKALDIKKEEQKKSKPIIKTGTISVSIEVENYKPNGRKWDGTGAPDISGKISFPDGSVLIIQKHQDSHTASGQVENVKLQKGDRIEIFLEDRDLSQNDNIATGSVIYPGSSFFKKSIGSAHLSFKFK